MRETTPTSDKSRDERQDKLRSTGDSRIVPGRRNPKQNEQPSLGDPENAPGRPGKTPDALRD